MIWVLYVCMAMLGVAFLITLNRLEKGRSNMDRAVALDFITSTSIGIVMVAMAMGNRIDLLPMLMVFASVGFVGSTAIARFTRVETDEQRRILSKEEAEANPEPTLSDDAEPVHPDAAEDDLDDADLDPKGL